MSSRDSTIFFGFRCPTASLSRQLFIENNILFKSIEFRIKNFYKHVDNTPSVPLFVSHPIDVPYAGAMGVQKGLRVLLI